MKKKKLVICGYGRMGQEIARLSQEGKSLQLSAVVDREAHSLKVPCLGQFKNLPEDHADIVIDFSSIELFREALIWCRKNKKAFVSGTTGLTRKDHADLKQAARSIPVFWAPNMSFGIAFVQNILKSFGALDSFDFQIEEFHHNKKKDSPSGTALLLQEELKCATGAMLPKEVSIRGGGIYGIHRIYAMSDEETITIEHAALNRTVFARGAVRAAIWMGNKKPGFYSMNEILQDSLKRKAK